MASYLIGDIASKLNISADTLRYYEKIGVLSKVARTASGRRAYNDNDIARLRFVRRAQKMNFTLAEIAALLKMRDHPQRARNKVRKLTEKKLADIETSLADLKHLRDELRLLLDLCLRGAKGCPIIERIDRQPAAGGQGKR